MFLFEPAKVKIFKEKQHELQIGISRKIKKILKADYPRGRAKGYYANFISAKKPKIEFSLFHPSVS